MEGNPGQKLSFLKSTRHWPGFPSKKCLVLLNQRFSGQDSPSQLARIPLLQHIYIYISETKTVLQPVSRLEKLMEGLLGSSGGGGFGRKFPEGALNLEVALVWKFPYGNLPKQSSKKFPSEPPKLLRNPSRSGSMQKLLAELS